MEKNNKDITSLFLLGGLLSFVSFLFCVTVIKNIDVKFVITPYILGTIWIVLPLILLYKPKGDSTSKEEQINRTQSIFPQIFGFLLFGFGIVFLISYNVSIEMNEIKTSKSILLFLSIILTLSMYCLSSRFVKNRDLWFIKDFRVKTIIMKISSLSILWAITIGILCW